MESDILKPWLAHLCTMLPGVQQAFVIENGEPHPRVHWPETATLTLASYWQPLCQAAMQQDAPLVSPLQVDGVSRLRIVAPLQQNHALLCELQVAPAQQQGVLKVIEWAKAWLQMLPLSSSDVKARPHDSEYLLWPCFRPALLAHDAAESAFALTLSLKSVLPAEQVCLFESINDQPNLLGLSSSADFDARSVLVQKLCELASSPTVQATGLSPVAVANIESLPAHIRSYSWFAIHLKHEHWQGRLFIACAPGQALSQAQQANLESLSEAMAALFAMRSRDSLTTRVLLQQLSRRLNPLRAWRAGRVWPKGWLFGGLIFLILATWTTPYRISTAVQIEPLSQRSLVAPFDGFVAQAYKRAGEAVYAGEEIARLDDRSLQLERQRWLSQIDEYRKQSRQALAKREQAEARIIEAQLNQAQAQLKLVEARLQRTRLLAPIDGLILEGDLSRALDAPVELGQVLFKIAPLNAYRVVFKVAETDVALLKNGLPATLRLKAFPQRNWSVALSDRALVYETDAASVWYRAEAPLDQDVSLLRPGMEGRGKIELGERSLLWQWTRDVRNWWRMLLWRWWP